MVNTIKPSEIAATVNTIKPSEITAVVQPSFTDNYLLTWSDDSDDSDNNN